MGQLAALLAWARTRAWQALTGAPGGGLAIVAGIVLVTLFGAWLRYSGAAEAVAIRDAVWVRKTATATVGAMQQQAALDRAAIEAAENERDRFADFAETARRRAIELEHAIKQMAADPICIP